MTCYVCDRELSVVWEWSPYDRAQLLRCDVCNVEYIDKRPWKK